MSVNYVFTHSFCSSQYLNLIYHSLEIPFALEVQESFLAVYHPNQQSLKLYFFAVDLDGSQHSVPEPIHNKHDRLMDT